MVDKATYSALKKTLVAVPAFSVVTVDYLDTQPNYFRVQNNGEAAIYCGTSHIPNQSKFDFMVKAAGVKMFAEPFYRAKLYIYNPSGTEVNITVLSFRAEFDPLTLALSDIEVDMSGVQIESNNVIGGFECSLPSGSNSIGKVEVENIKDYQSTLDVIKGNQKDYSVTLASILTAIGNISGGSGGGSSAWGASQIENLLSVIQKKDYILSAAEYTAPAAGFAVPFDGKEAVKLNTLSNDGESDLTITFEQANVTGQQTFTLKAGEVLNDVEGPITAMTLTGDDVPFRLLCTVRTVG